MEHGLNTDKATKLNLFNLCLIRVPSVAKLFRPTPSTPGALRHATRTPRRRTAFSIRAGRLPARPRPLRRRGGRPPAPLGQGGPGARRGTRSAGPTAKGGRSGSRSGTTRATASMGCSPDPGGSSRACEQVLDDEVYHYHSKMIMKDALVGGAWAWHQDYGYWYQNGVLFPGPGQRLHRRRPVHRRERLPPGDRGVAPGWGGSTTS